MQQINFFESGSGFPIVFLHGFCESNKIWKELSTALSDEYRILCPDLPGFGKSPLTEKQFSLEEIGDQIIEWLKELSITKCIVIGHSLGGYITLQIFRKHRDFVPAIGLFNSSAFEDSDEKKENRNKLIQFIRENGVAPFLRTFVPSLFYPPTADQYQHIIQAIEQDGLTLSPESVIRYAAAMRERPDSMDLLKDFPEHMMLIAGEQDQNVPLEKTKEMAQYLPEANVHMMPQSAHMSLFEQSEKCYRAIRAFARKMALN